MWTAGILAGAALGYILIKQAVITRADAPRSLYRQADYTALPFMMLAFGVKYVLGVMSAVSPQTMQQPAMSALAIVSGGVFAACFLGKFARYVGCITVPHRARRSKVILSRVPACDLSITAECSS